MRRFFALVSLLCLAIPAGISISGCTRNPGANYCNGLGYGLKITDVAKIDLEPRTTGISLSFGQTQQVQSPTATTCKGTSASVSSYIYGTTNNQLVDISPSGNICAGTWNRNSGGGIADYTICRFPNPLPSTSSLPYGSAYITASANAVSSDPVQVFVHAQVTSVSLALAPADQGRCISQAEAPVTLDAQACYSSSINPSGTPQNYLLCAPPFITSANQACPLPYVQGANGQFTPVPLSSISECTPSIGTLTYSVGTAAVGSINSETNQITAEQPGTTAITASIAGSGSSAGYLTVCPPASISVSLNGSTGTSTPVVVSQGVTQNLVTEVIDTRGNPITGLTLDYQSTNPADITAGSAGAITTSFPGQTSIYAICQPPTCNPAPINQIGAYGTGLSISSNPVAIKTPGTASSYYWLAAPGVSPYLVAVELITGTVASPMRLPYVPNSMVMDALGNNLYLGSSHELMIVNTATNTLTKSDTTVPGVVLAVSPNNQQVLINDQQRQLFYIYNASGTIASQFSGLGNAATWSPDAKTLYITDSSALNDPANGLITGHTDSLYVYNVNSGWTYYPNTINPTLLPPSPLPPSGVVPVPPGSMPWADLPPNEAVTSMVQTPALTVPGVGAYLRGTPTVAHTWCPTGTVGNYASFQFYPQGDSVTNVQADALAATVDGTHILAAAMTGSGLVLNDIGVTIPSSPGSDCPVTTNATTGVQTLSELSISHNPPAQFTLANVTAATSVNQVVASPASNLAFITYTGGATTGGPSVPYYAPGANGTAGTVGYVPLSGTAATAPLAGAFSSDDTVFFVSTGGDNQIHYISIGANGALSDTQQISPNLPACRPGSDPGCNLNPAGAPSVVPATAIAVKPRATT